MYWRWDCVGNLEIWIQGRKIPVPKSTGIRPGTPVLQYIVLQYSMEWVPRATVVVSGSIWIHVCIRRTVQKTVLKTSATVWYQYALYQVYYGSRTHCLKPTSQKSKTFPNPQSRHLTFGIPCTTSEWACWVERGRRWSSGGLLEGHVQEQHFLPDLFIFHRFEPSLLRVAAAFTHVDWALWTFRHLSH